MTRIGLRKIAALLALGTILAASSCGGCYYARLTIGQARVLLGRESIDDALASDRLGAEEKRKLALVQKVRVFAQDGLGLARNGSDTRFYDTGDAPVSWNVTACERTSFRAHEWTFPFVGKAAYKGFFDLEQARAEGADLEAEGYDVVVREVGAYSTLGWFDDPVFRRMLRGSIYDLASTIVHELTHATVFRKGDMAFNESVATFVGNEGGLRFLEAEYGAQSAEFKAARDEIADEATFSLFVDGLYERLDAVYKGSASPEEKLRRREEIFAACKVEFEALRKAKMRAPESYAWFAKKKLNNAVIVGYRAYHTDLGDFARVLRACGGDMKAAVAVFREAAERDDPRAHLAAFVGEKGESDGVEAGEKEGNEGKEG